MTEVKYTFSASNASDVVAAFKSIGAAAESAAASAKKLGTASRSASAKTVAGSKRAKQAMSFEERARRRQLSQINRLRDQSIRSARKEASARKRIADKSARDEIKAADKAARKRVKIAKRAQEKISAGRRRMMRQIGRRALTAGILGVGAGMAAAARLGSSAVREGVGLRDQATQLAIKGQTGGGPRVSGAEILRGAQQTALNVPGAKAADVMEGMGAFVQKVGRVDVATKFKDLMATMSMATGAKIKDVGSAMADLYQKFDIKTPQQMAKVMAQLAVQGKKGAFELSDMAKRLPRMAAAARSFGLRGPESVGVLGGLVQMVRQGAGSGAQAATFTENMLRQIERKSGKIESITGRKVFTKGGDPRDIQNTIASMMEAAGTPGAGGTPPGLKAFNFNKRAEAALKPFFIIWKDAYKETGNAAEATKRLKEEMQKAIKAPGALKEIMEDAKTASKTTKSIQTAAWENIRSSVNKELMPAFASLAKNLGSLAKNTTLFQTLGGVLAGVVGGFEILIRALGGASKKIGPTDEEKRKALGQAKTAQGELAEMMAKKKKYALLGDTAMSLSMDPVIAAQRAKMEALETRGGMGVDQGILSKKQFVNQLTDIMVEGESKYQRKRDPNYVMGKSAVALQRRKARMIADNIITNESTGMAAVAEFFGGPGGYSKEQFMGQVHTGTPHADIDREKATRLLDRLGATAVSAGMGGEVGAEASRALEGGEIKANLSNLASALEAAAGRINAVRPGDGGDGGRGNVFQ